METSTVEEPTEQHNSDILTNPTAEEESGPPEEETIHLEEPSEAYEPVWATDEVEPAPSGSGVVKRRSFFDELD